MIFDEFIEILGALPFFDLATVVQLVGGKRNTVRTQLHRWIKSGKLVSLRRGMYAFGERYRRATVVPAEVANRLYVPSYLSCHWALGYYGLIPEGVAVHTSVTTRVPRQFTNEFGMFRYSNIKRPCLFGYARVTLQQRPVLLASPEKALLDLWHLASGEWDTERMAGMRFQNFDLVQQDCLDAYAARFRSPRLLRAVRAWRILSKSEMDGTVEL